MKTKFFTAMLLVSISGCGKALLSGHSKPAPKPTAGPISQAPAVPKQPTPQPSQSNNQTSELPKPLPQPGIIPAPVPTPKTPSPTPIPTPKTTPKPDPVGTMDSTGMSCHDADFTFCHEYFSIPSGKAEELRRNCEKKGDIFEHKACPRTQRSACVRQDTRVNSRFACFMYAPAQAEECLDMDGEFTLIDFVKP